MSGTRLNHARHDRGGQWKVPSMLQSKLLLKYALLQYIYLGPQVPAYRQQGIFPWVRVPFLGMLIS